jgi:hypothetical protein
MKRNGVPPTKRKKKSQIIKAIRAHYRYGEPANNCISIHAVDAAVQITVVPRTPNGNHWEAM